MSDNISTRVAYPSATVYLGGKPVDPISLFIEARVGEFPRATVDYQPSQTTDSIKSVMPSEFTGLFAAAQEKLFEAAQDGSISAEDGLGGFITFEGYNTNNAYTVLAGSVGYKATITHKSAGVDLLKTNNYYTSQDLFRAFKEVPKGDVNYGTWLKAVLELIIKNWEEKKDRTTLSEHVKRLQARQHTINEPGLEIWYEILDNSTAVNEKLSVVLDERDFVEPLAAAIQNVYTTSYGVFSQAINVFANMFQMVYVPDMDDNVGKFINFRDLIADPEAKDVNLRQMDLSAGAKEIVPTTQVVVKGIPSPAWRDSFPNDVKNGYAPYMTTFPVGVESGQVVEMSAPSWLNIKLIPSKLKPDPAVNPPGLDNYTGQRTLRNNHARHQLSSFIVDVVDEWAKDAYVNWALADSTAMLVVALDFSWVVGKVYKVMADDVVLFNGFLHSVSHSLGSNHSSPSANTNLFFTHIQAEGFTLPGI